MHNRIVGVIGPKGSGKTHAVCEAMAQMERVAAFDMTDDSLFLWPSEDAITGQPRALYESLRQDAFKVVYRPTEMEMEDDRLLVPEFEMFVRLCFLRGRMAMVIDEAHQLCTARTCPVALLQATWYGRKRELDIYYIAQSFSAVSRPITRNTDEFWFWRIIEPADIDGIRDRCGSETAQKVSSLRKLELDENRVIQPGEMAIWDIWNGLRTSESTEKEAPCQEEGQQVPHPRNPEDVNQHQ